MRDLRVALIIALIANVGAGIVSLSRPARDVLADVLLAGAWALAGVTFLAYERRLRLQGMAATRPLRYSGIFVILAALAVIGRVVDLQLD